MCEEEEEEREWLSEERERKVRLVLLEKKSVGVDGFCFGEILQWVARDEHKGSVTEAIVAICPLLSQSSQLWFFCVSLFFTLGSGKQAYPIRFCANDPSALQIALFMQQLLYSNQARQIRTSWSKWDCRIYWIVNYKFLRIFKFKVKNKLIMILYIE